MTHLATPKHLLLPDYTVVAFPEYWDRPKSKRPKTLRGLKKLLLPQPGIRGIWEITATDTRTGEILERNVVPNAITDVAAQAAIADIFAASAVTTTPFNILCISTEAGPSTLTTALTAGQAAVTSLAVAALPNAIASGTTLKLSYSTGSEETCVTSAAASAGATSISVTSFTTTYAHAVGSTVVPVASPTDNPSASPTGAQYQTLVAGDFTAVSGSGVGNRTRTITKTFAGGSYTAATYTWARLTNANPIVTGATGASCIVPQAVINSTTSQTFTIVIKL